MMEADRNTDRPPEVPSGAEGEGPLPPALLLSAVSQAAEEVARQIGLSETLAAIIDGVRLHLGFDGAGVFLCERSAADAAPGGDAARGQVTHLIGVERNGSLEPPPRRAIPIEGSPGPLRQVVLGQAPYFVGRLSDRDGQSEQAIVPLVAHGEIIGALAVDNLGSGRPISRALTPPLCLFGHFAAVAISNALKRERLDRIRVKLDQLAETCSAMAGLLDTEALLPAILQSMHEVLGAKRYAVWHRQPDNSWRCVARAGVSDGYVSQVGRVYEPRGENDESPAARFFASGRVVVVHDVEHCEALGALRPLMRAEGIHALVGIPLVQHGELVGCVLLYDSEGDAIRPEDVELAELFAGYAAAALGNALSYDEGCRLRATVARLTEELQTDQQLLLAAFEAAGDVTREEDPARMLASVIQNVRVHLNVDDVEIYHYRSELKTLRRLADAGGSEPGEETSISTVPGPLRAVLSGALPYAHSPAGGPPEADRGGAAVVPLIFHGIIIGAMVVDNRRSGRAIPARLLPPLRFFGHFTAIVVTTALKQQELLLAEAQKKQFYRDIVYAVTNGKLVLCEREEIEQHWRETVAEQPVVKDYDVKAVRDAIQRVARHAGMPDDRVEDLTLCASEAATNALKHAGGGRVSLDYEGETVRVRVADEGSGIDTLQLPRATLMKGYSTRASMGLGFTLMHELADRLYLNTGPHGTTVILEMALQRRSEAEKMLALLNLAE